MMNGKPRVERVPLTEAEAAYLAPIFERFEQAQKELDAVLKLFGAQHAHELTPGATDWQLTKTGFVRVLPPEQTDGVAAMPPANEVQPHMNGNGAVARQKKRQAAGQTEELVQE